MSDDRFDVLERFTPLFDLPEPSLDGFMHRRDRVRRNKRLTTGAVAIAVLVALVVSLTIVRPSDRTQLPADTNPTVPSSARVGFVGLPPEGSTPSTPETGELILYVQGPSTSSRTWVYADGRLIWHRYADIPEGANERFTGFLEQRLTPEGVELLRSEAVSSAGLGDGDELPPGGVPLPWPTKVEVLNGGRLVNVDRDLGGDVGRLVSRIFDAALWLPAGAWDDREIRAYVPSRYRVCYTEAGSFALLPEPAQDLLAGASAPPGNPVVHPGGPAGTALALVCADLTIEELRALDQALDDAGIDRDSPNDGYRGGPDPWSLTYRIDRGGEDTPAVERRSILVEPYLPHGQVYCQHCDIRG